MKGRKLLVLAMAIVTLTIVSVEAVVARDISASPSLSFIGTTAHCSGDCTANTTADRVIIRLILYENGVYETMWRAEGDGAASIYETYPVTRGNTYTLSLTHTVNGVTPPAIEVTKTCH